MTTIDPAFAGAVRKLTAAARLVEDNLGDAHKGLLREPREAVEAFLQSAGASVPAPVTEFRQQDCKVDYTEGPNGPRTHVTITHVPTGISFESYSKATPEDNEQVAGNAVERAVKKRLGL